MAQLVALKICIGLRKNGHADHPPLNKIPSKVRKDMDWSLYIDRFGSGCLYDKACGHRELEADSPIGCQWLVLLAPKDFAEAALEVMDDKYKASVLTEGQLESFYDSRACAHLSEYDIDERALSEIDQLEELEKGNHISPPSSSEEARRKKARDPKDQSERGIRKNLRKRWRDRKKAMGWTITNPSQVKRPKKAGRL